MTRAEQEATAAIHHGIDTLAGTSRAEKFAALLALRTVAFHLDLTELHAELDRMLDEIGGKL